MAAGIVAYGVSVTLNIWIFSKLTAATGRFPALRGVHRRGFVADRRHADLHHRLLLRRAADRRADAGARCSPRWCCPRCWCRCIIIVCVAHRPPPRRAAVKLRLLAALLALARLHRGAAPSRPARPRLIVAISVDQFSADLFAEYRRHFTGGLRRLSQGAVFPAGYQSHAATETCPGHSTILTGDRPARTGIIANNWYRPGRRARRQIYLLRRGRARPRQRLRPLHRLRRPSARADARRPDAAAPIRASRVVAVAGKDRAAVMMGGHNPDRALVVGRPGLRHPRRPRDAGRGRRRQRPGRRALWPARTSAMPLDPTSAPAAAAPCRSPAAPRTVGDGRFARAAGDQAPFRASPDFDAAILDLAAGIARRRCGSARARRPTSSPSASRRPIMSATATAPRAPRCASSCSRSTARSAPSSPRSTAPGSTMS